MFFCWGSLRSSLQLPAISYQGWDPAWCFLSWQFFGNPGRHAKNPAQQFTKPGGHFGYNSGCPMSNMGIKTSKFGRQGICKWRLRIILLRDKIQPISWGWSIFIGNRLRVVFSSPSQDTGNNCAVCSWTFMKLLILAMVHCCLLLHSWIWPFRQLTVPRLTDWQILKQGSWKHSLGLPRSIWLT